MQHRCAKFMIALMMLCHATDAGAQEQHLGGDSLVRLLSPDFRQMEKRLDEIYREMASLPEVLERPWGYRYGFRSADLKREDTPSWLQIDLGAQRKVDMLALVPVNLDYLGKSGEGYGFPKRFKIELSDHADMRDAVVLVDQSQADVTNPGKYPLVHEFPARIGRYIRMTSLKHPFQNGTYFWALEEWLVLEGNMNVAVSRSENLSHSSSLDLFPQWAPTRIVDGQSTLGMPVDVTSPSPTQGYMSKKLGMKEVTPPLTESQSKWCMVDLGKTEQIEQVRLLPLQSETYEVVDGRGFPRDFNLQLSNDPGFGEILWETRRVGLILGYPAGSSLNIIVPDIKARYVRMIATDLWSRDDFYIFGLAELQVYGSNRNLALGKEVRVKDAADKPEDSGWSPAYLVDGYTSKHRLIEWPNYLKLTHQRGQLEIEREALETKLVNKSALIKKCIIAISLLAGFSAVAGWIWVSLRQRMLIKRETEELRQQIARDLHDDIGSNLGGIVLLSEIGSQHSTDTESRSDFETIRQAAADASSSMRDIVWLIQQNSMNLKDFVSRMRQSLHMILKHHDVSMDIEPAVFKDRSLSLLFRRHVFLSFKEVLNNVRKHSESSQVTVRIEIEPQLFRFMVRDHGVGFDPETMTNLGHGLGNLKRRASRLMGSVQITSFPDKGTEVTFEAPFA